MSKIKVALIYGGANSEHEVSISSARTILANLDENTYEVIPIYISRSGEWSHESDLLLGSQSIQELESLEVIPEISQRSNIRKNKFPDSLYHADVVFPVLHGKMGEDGTIQGLLEILGIPYVGSGVLGSAMSMDKDIQKQICRAHGIPVVSHKVIRIEDYTHNQTEIIGSIEQEFSYPVFVKPANAGSSVGVSRADSKSKLIESIDIAFKFDTKVIIEKAILNPREIECSILGNANPQASVLGEIIPSGEFYDYEAKYISNNSQAIVPAKISKTLAEKISSLAIKTFQVMQCSGLARVDFLVEAKSNKVYLNELNTMPGFTEISMYPKLWEASGLLQKKLVEKLIDLAFENNLNTNS